MTPADLCTLVTAFFVTHLAGERNVSAHTTAAYRDALKLLLRFAAQFHQRPVAHLCLDDLGAPVILAFLSDLETSRRNTVRTRNARLAAIHAFFRYVLDREPAVASLCQRVLAIPFKRAAHPALGYLSEHELHGLLQHIDRAAPMGERDYVLLALLYDTGARVQEVLDLTPLDFHLDSPAFVRVRGKGRKERLCPLLPQTARLVRRFLAEQGRSPDEQAPLFTNRAGRPLSQHGARYLLRKHLAGAHQAMGSVRHTRITPHTLRHTKAMHLLQAGVPLMTIKDILGHADVKSTEIYVQADLEMKEEALHRVGTPSGARRRKPLFGQDLLAWLESL